MKKGEGNGIFWSNIGSGFGESGGTPSARIPRSTPPGSNLFSHIYYNNDKLRIFKDLDFQVFNF